MLKRRREDDYEKKDFVCGVALTDELDKFTLSVLGV